MFFSYLKFAWRNFKKNKVYSFINISGLAIGMVCSILILLWLVDELNYDRFHSNRHSIYRILVDTESANSVTKSSTTPNTLGPVLAENYSDISAVTRYVGGFSGWLIRYEDKSFTNDRWAAADPAFFQMFSFPFLAGNPGTALQEQQSVVITDKMAQKYFGDDIALGKVIKKDNTDLYVTGIIHIPENSHIQFDYLFPIENMRRWFYQELESWDVGIFRTYIQVRTGFSGAEVAKKIASIIPEHNPQMKAQLSLQPLTDIHLRTTFPDQCNYQQGNITYVYILSLVALCVLLVACINFMNLSTSRSSIRVKEIGVRKAIGARRWELIGQLLGESVMYALISMILAILIIKLILPVFTTFIGKNLEFLSFSNFKMLFWLTALTFVVGIFAGSYQAFVLSSFTPINTLKAGLVHNVPSHARIRNI